MRISRTLGGATCCIHGKDFPMNCVVLYLDNGFTLVSSDFRHSRHEPLLIFVYNLANRKWEKTYDKNIYTEIMWDYYTKNIRRGRSRKSSKSKKQKYKDTTTNKNGMKKIPNSVCWAMTHPFQGGRVSPR